MCKALEECDSRRPEPCAKGYECVERVCRKGQVIMQNNLTSCSFNGKTWM